MMMIGGMNMILTKSDYAILVKNINMREVKHINSISSFCFWWTTISAAVSLKREMGHENELILVNYSLPYYPLGWTFGLLNDI